MTEAEWRECDDPNRMMFLPDLWETFWTDSPVTDRRLNLLVLACARRDWPRLSESYRRFIESGEDCPEKPLSAFGGTLPRPNNAAECAICEIGGVQGVDAELIYIAKAAAGVPPGQMPSLAHAGYRRERGCQAELLRDIFGYPFRQITIDSSVRPSSVVALAQAIYADRAFDRLPLLADALEDAGCTDAAILEHCRGPGPHVRGCWVVDLLLGKS